MIRVRGARSGAEGSDKLPSHHLSALCAVAALAAIVVLAGCAVQPAAVVTAPASASPVVAATQPATEAATASPDATATAAPAATSSASTAATQAEPVTLTFAVADAEDTPSKPYVDEFVQQVKTLSGGGLTVEPTFSAGQGNFEQGVIKAVTGGKYDLGLAGARAWDPIGVDSFQALQTPFLITNDELAKAVATSDAAQRMLDNLSTAGVTGLVIWPEDLRHPFSLVDGKPVLSPSDFVGQNVRVTPSKLSNALISGMGGKPIFDDQPYQIAESGLRQGADLQGRATATGNVVFFAKFQSLFANAAAFNRLSQAQQDVLRRAAVATRAKALAEHPSDAQAGATWCADGGGIVNASPEQVAALEKAAQPVIDLMEQKATNKELIAAIRELKAKTEPSALAAPCAPVPIATAMPAQVETWSTGPLPNGVWKVELSTDDFFRFGMLRSAAESGWTGTYVMTVEDGKMSYTWTGLNGQTGACQTTTSMDGDAVRLSYGQDCGGEVDHVRWRLDKDGLHIHLVDIVDGPAIGMRTQWEAQPWQKVQ